MSSFPRQYRSVLAALFFAGVLALVAWFGIFPLHEKIRTEKDNIQKAIVDGEMREELAADLPALRRQAEKVGRQKELLDVVIPKSRIVSLIEEIESLANDARIDIAIEAKPKEASKRPKTDPKKGAAGQAKDGKKEGAPPETLLEKLPTDQYLEIAITLQGEYDGIVRFIRNLEAMPYATDVLSLEVGVPDKAAQSGAAVPRNVFSPSTETENEGGSGGAEDGEASQEGSGPEILQAKLGTVVYVLEDKLAYVFEKKKNGGALGIFRRAGGDGVDEPLPMGVLSRVSRHVRMGGVLLAPKRL
jgi:HAMP domain-containing protein